MAKIIRPARTEDAGAACAVIRESITLLCGPDHAGDVEHIARWLSNKTPANVARWIEQSHFFVVERDGKILGVAAMTADGKVTLNYVSPEARFSGISNALLTQLEQTANLLGVRELRLETTKTALPFYSARGYSRSAETYVLPLTKTLATVLVKRLTP